MNEAKSESLKQMKSAGMHHEPEGNIGVLNSNAIFFRETNICFNGNQIYIPKEKLQWY